MLLHFPVRAQRFVEPTMFFGIACRLKLRIRGTAHFIDDWAGETAYLKVGPHIVWTDSHDVKSAVGTMNVCGDSTVPESKFSVVIDVTLPHTADSVQLCCQVFHGVY